MSHCLCGYQLHPSLTVHAQAPYITSLFAVCLKFCRKQNDTFFHVHLKRVRMVEISDQEL